MATRHLAERYVGTVGGPLWTILQPAATVAVFWFVFSVGFKAHGPSDIPFIVYFLGGYVPWLLFSEVIQASTTCIVGNRNLVKKTTFPTEILPVVYIVSSTISHLVLLLIFAAVIAVSPQALSGMFSLFLYFYGCLLVLALGVSWLVASLQVFSRDTAQVTAVLLNLWFWLTPIAWPENIVPTEVMRWLSANPMYYVVTGYRYAFLGMNEFATDPLSTIRFWVGSLLVLFLGAYVFRRLKPEFPDVL